MYVGGARAKRIFYTRPYEQLVGNKSKNMRGRVLLTGALMSFSSMQRYD